MVYLHGFMSSPNALKASIIQAYLNEKSSSLTFLRPAINDKPSIAIPALIHYFTELHQQYDRIIIIGSSLGGFYADCMAQRFNLSVVLINPLVDASERMIHYDVASVGQLENPYTKHQFSITVEDRQAIDELETSRLASTPALKLVLLQMGDEVLDAGLAARYYQRSCCIITPGGDHQFQGFEQYTDMIFKWLGLYIK